AGEDHERHAHRDDEQEGVVDEDVEDDLAGGEPLVADTARREHRCEQACRHQHRDVSARDGESSGPAEDGRVPPVSSGHAGTLSFSPDSTGTAGALPRRPNTLARNAGDCSRHTSVTTSALNSSVVSGGTPIE